MPQMSPIIQKLPRLDQVDLSSLTERGMKNKCQGGKRNPWKNMSPNIFHHNATYSPWVKALQESYPILRRCLCLPPVPSSLLILSNVGEAGRGKVKGVGLQRMDRNVQPGKERRAEEEGAAPLGIHKGPGWRKHWGI